MPSHKTLVVLDVGLANPVTGKSFSQIVSQGQILALPVDGSEHGLKLVTGDGAHVRLPDGIVYSKKHQRLYFTNMGIPPLDDGTVYSVRPDGTDPQIVLSKGHVHTPKQLALDSLNEDLYISDREGLRVVRCKVDGTSIETLISTGNPDDPADAKDQTKWCVGIAVSNKNGRFYWTQKGPSKAGMGRIFSAPIAGLASDREPSLLLDGLPEPIDLEIDEQENTLYWTDRGEVPYGNTFNRVALDSSGAHPKTTTKSAEGLRHEILVQNFHEAIGLVFDSEARKWYVADMGGTIWSFDVDGRNQKVVYDERHRAFTGITLVG